MLQSFRFSRLSHGADFRHFFFRREVVPEKRDAIGAVSAVESLLQAFDVVDVGGQERENMDVVRRILDLTGASPDLVRHVADRPGHDRRYAVDSSKVRGLGWTPQHSFDAGGLEATVEWYRESRDWWEPIKSGDYRRYYDEQYAARLGSN